MITPALLLPIAMALQAGSAPRVVEPDPGLSYGTIIWGEPTVTDLARPGIVPVRLDAVIAEQQVEIRGAEMLPERQLTIGAPFNYAVPASRYAFRLYRTAAGDRWCLSGIPGVRYSPPHDEHGDIFPGACLIDADGDGAYETIHMLAYDRGIAPRDVAIAPLRLRPSPPPTDPRISRLHVLRRLRVAELGERDVVLALEHAWVPRPNETPDYEQGDLPERVTLALRPGATVAIAGIQLRIAGGPGAWRIEASGGFTPWARLEQNGAAVQLGPYYLAPRED
jgi:hypothetical protein